MRTMKLISDRILFPIAAANNIEVMTGGIGNTYLNTNTKKIFTQVQDPGSNWYVSWMTGTCWK